MKSVSSSININNLLEPKILVTKAHGIGPKNQTQRSPVGPTYPPPFPSIIFLIKLPQTSPKLHKGHHPPCWHGTTATSADATCRHHTTWPGEGPWCPWICWLGQWPHWKLYPHQRFLFPLTIWLSTLRIAAVDHGCEGRSWPSIGKWWGLIDFWEGKRVLGQKQREGPCWAVGRVAMLDRF